MNCVPRCGQAKRLSVIMKAVPLVVKFLLVGGLRSRYLLKPEMHMVCAHYDQLRCQTEIFSEDRNLQRQFVCDING